MGRCPIPPSGGVWWCKVACKGCSSVTPRASMPARRAPAARGGNHATGRSGGCLDERPQRWRKGRAASTPSPGDWGIGARRARARARDAVWVGQGSTSRILREGFVVGATNPKGLIIFTAVLPQFIHHSQGHETLQLATLGLLCAVIALLSDSSW